MKGCAREEFHPNREGCAPKTGMTTVNAQELSEQEALVANVPDQVLAELVAAVKNNRPTRGSKVAKVALGVLAAIAAAALGLVAGLPNLVERANDALLPLPNRQNLPLPVGLIGPVSESSYRQNTSGTKIHPGAGVLDDNVRTTWVECAGGRPVNAGSQSISRVTPQNPRARGNTCRTDDEGVDEWLQIPLSEEQGIDLKAISIKNGAERDAHEFLRNPRVRDLTVSIWTYPTPNSTGPSATFTTTLADEIYYQTFPCKYENVTQVRFTIASTYHGEDIDTSAKDLIPGTSIVETTFARSSDTAISDIQLIPSRIYRSSTAAKTGLAVPADDDH